MAWFRRGLLPWREFSGELRSARRAQRMAEQGQGKEALALLDHPEFVPELDQDARNRLKRNTVLLADAHEKDRLQAEKREAAEQARQQEQAALAFTTGFRARLAEGAATLADIAQAETGGILSPARADRLRDELAADELHRDPTSTVKGHLCGGGVC